MKTKFLIIIVLAIIMVSLTTSAFAQYYGEIKSHEFLIDHEGQHEIRLQSSTTKFNDVFYDEPADVIIISIDSGNTFTDIISIQMNYSSFRTLLADSKDADPSNVLVLLDGEEQEYYTPRIIAGNVTWEFKNKPNITEIELILKPERYRDNKTQDSDFRYPPGSARMAEKYPVKQQYEMGLKFENLKCNEGHVLIQKYDGTPACVTESTKQKLIERGWTGNDSAISKVDTNCMTIQQSKETATFFKIPTYLPEGYSHVCSRSGTPSESYIVYYYQGFPNNWQIHELVGDGAIFIYQTDERNMVGDKKFQTYGSPEQRIRETYDDVMEKNPSLNPQLITINGMLAYAVDSCSDCGIQAANFPDGTMIQESTSSETRIKFIDENGVSYMLETTLPLSELIKVAESLQ